MIAYPMIQMPTVKDFVKRLEEEYGVVTKDVTCLSDHEGELWMRYLYREVDDVKRGVMLPQDLDIESDMLTPSVIRNICDRLDIPKGDFGFTLD